MKYKIVFCISEYLTKNVNYFGSLHDLLPRLNKIARFVLDEIHTVKAWDDNFRPTYKAFSILKEIYTNVPILVLTATSSIKGRR